MKRQYVVDTAGGTRLQGVKDLFPWEVEYFTSLGYTFTEYRPAVEPRGMSRLTQTYVAYHALAMQLRTVQRERGIESQP